MKVAVGTLGLAERDLDVDADGAHSETLAYWGDGDAASELKFV
jgi:hypothetical protein